MARELRQRRVLDQRARGQVDQPRRQHAAAPPDLGDLGDREVEAVLLGDGRVAGAAHDVEALGERLHDAVLDAVVDHLDEVPAADRAAVQVAVLGGAADLLAAGRALDAAAPRREGLEDRIEALHRGAVAADHQAVAALEAEHAAAGAGVDVGDLLAGERPGAADVVLEERVAAVDHGVARFEHVAELRHGGLGGRAGGDHDPHRARLGQPGDQTCERVAAGGALGGQRLHGVGAAVVDDALMAIAHQPARHVRAHPAKSDHSELHPLPPG